MIVVTIFLNPSRIGATASGLKRDVTPKELVPSAWAARVRSEARLVMPSRLVTKSLAVTRLSCRISWDSRGIVPLWGAGEELQVTRRAAKMI